VPGPARIQSPQVAVVRVEANEEADPCESRVQAAQQKNERLFLSGFERDDSCRQR